MENENTDRTLHNHEEKAREFMMNWAKENQIDATIDEVGNIITTETPGKKPQ